MAWKIVSAEGLTTWRVGPGGRACFAPTQQGDVRTSARIPIANVVAAKAAHSSEAVKKLQNNWHKISPLPINHTSLPDSTLDS
jgi:hypothetical protein